MIRTLIAVSLIAGLFPSWGHKFVNVSCEVVGAVVSAVGGIENFAVGIVLVAVVAYVKVNRK